MREHEIAAARRAKADEWESEFSTHSLLPWESAPFDDLKALLRRIGCKDGRALDVGCGTGMHLSLLSDGFEHVVGLDIARGALVRSRERCAECGLVMADAPTLPFVDGAFGLVIDRGCFHHMLVVQRRAYVREVHRVLKRGGTYQLVCFSSRNGNAINHFTRVQIRRYFCQHFTIEGFEELELVEHHTRQRRYMYSVVMEKKDGCSITS